MPTPSMIGGSRSDQKELAVDPRVPRVDHSLPVRSSGSADSEREEAGAPWGEVVALSQPAHRQEPWTPELPAVEDLPPVRPADVRAWAARQGIWLADRGKVPVLVTEQYRAALALSESMGRSGGDFLGR